MFPIRKRYYFFSCLFAVVLFFYSQETHHANIVQPIDSQVSTPAQIFPQSTRILASSAQPAPQPTLRRQDDMENLLGDLRTTSSQQWEMQLDNEGRFLKKISGGLLSYRGKSLAAASSEFLHKYGKKLFGLDPASLLLKQFNDKGVLKNIIYQQSFDGIPVYQSRVALFFDSEMNLVHANVDDKKYPPPGHASPALDEAAAANIIHNFLQKKFPNADLHSHSSQSIRDRLEYFFYENNGTYARVYRVVIALTAPVYGDHEWIIDADSGALVVERNLSRK